MFAALSLGIGAQTFNEWKDPRINEVNRAPMHSNYFAYETAEAAAVAEKEQSLNYMTLNGDWKFVWVQNSDARPTDFWKKDYEDDEKGKFPQDLKRGVLSQDGLYNMFSDNDELMKKMERFIRKQNS